MLIRPCLAYHNPTTTFHKRDWGEIWSWLYQDVWCVRFERLWTQQIPISQQQRTRLAKLKLWSFSRFSLDFHFSWRILLADTSIRKSAKASVEMHTTRRLFAVMKTTHTFVSPLAARSPFTLRQTSRVRGKTWVTYFRRDPRSICRANGYSG